MSYMYNSHRRWANISINIKQINGIWIMGLITTICSISNINGLGKMGIGNGFQVPHKTVQQASTFFLLNKTKTKTFNTK